MENAGMPKGEGTPFRIVLDPGHGGEAPGTRGPSGTLEKDVNLEVARILAQRLRSRGLHVVLTREEDRFLSLDDRVAVDGDLWISIHHNATASGPPPVHRGEFYIPLDRLHPSWELAREMIRAFRDPRWPAPPHPEPLPATYRVLRPERVSLLSEACYLTHPEGERLFREGEGARLEAELLEKGIVAFLERAGGRVPRVLHAERHGDRWVFLLDGKVDPDSLDVRLGGRPLSAVWVDSRRVEVRIPQNWPGGRWELFLQFFTPGGVPSLPYRTTITLSRPIQSFHVSAYPLAYRVPSYVVLRVLDAFGNPAPPGLKAQVRLRDGEILAGDTHTRGGGEIHLVVHLPRGNGVLEVDLPGFTGVGQLTYQERRHYQYGRVVDGRTGEPLTEARLRLHGKTYTVFPEGWFFLPGRGDISVEAPGYRPKRVSGVSGEVIALEPLLDGVWHRKLWVEGPSRARTLVHWIRKAGGRVRIPEEGTSEVDRVFSQNAFRPDWSLIIEEGDPFVGYFPGVPPERSEEPARQLAHTLNRMGYGVKVRAISFYRLIQYTGPRVVLAHPSLDPPFLHALFAALTHLLGGPPPWRRVVRVLREGRGVEGVRIWGVGYPAWTLSGVEGLAHLWLPEPDLPVRADVDGVVIEELDGAAQGEVTR